MIPEPVRETVKDATQRLRRAVAAPRSRHRDVLAMASINALGLGYLPWSRFAMRPLGLATVLNDVVLNERVNIVECGGGVSTLCVAKLLEDLGRGRLTTIEGDPRWAAYVRSELHRHGLTHRCVVIDAAIADNNPGLGPWYSTTVLDQSDLTGIDLLVVDGPPAFLRSRMHARWAALPYFFDRLAPACCVILDDVTRKGEQEVLRSWESRYPVRFDRRATAGAIAIWCRGGSAVVV